MFFSMLGVIPKEFSFHTNCWNYICRFVPDVSQLLSLLNTALISTPDCLFLDGPLHMLSILRSRMTASDHDQARFGNPDNQKRIFENRKHPVRSKTDSIPQVLLMLWVC